MFVCLMFQISWVLILQLFRIPWVLVFLVFQISWVLVLLLFQIAAAPGHHPTTPFLSQCFAQTLGRGLKLS